MNFLTHAKKLLQEAIDACIGMGVIKTCVKTTSSASLLVSSPDNHMMGHIGCLAKTISAFPGLPVANPFYVALTLLLEHTKIAKRPGYVYPSGVPCMSRLIHFVDDSSARRKGKEKENLELVLVRK